MYLRHTTVTKNGKTHTYWRLVRSVRTGNRVRQQTVAQLGELDAAGRVRARALAESIDGGANDAFVRVEKLDYKPSIKAQLRILVQTADGPKERSITVQNGGDLYTLSNERTCY